MKIDRMFSSGVLVVSSFVSDGFSSMVSDGLAANTSISAELSVFGECRIRADFDVERKPSLSSDKTLVLISRVHPFDLLSAPLTGYVISQSLEDGIVSPFPPVFEEGVVGIPEENRYLLDAKCPGYLKDSHGRLPPLYGKEIEFTEALKQVDPDAIYPICQKMDRHLSKRLKKCQNKIIDRHMSSSKFAIVTQGLFHHNSNLLNVLNKDYNLEIYWFPGDQFVKNSSKSCQARYLYAKLKTDIQHIYPYSNGGLKKDDERVVQIKHRLKTLKSLVGTNLYYSQVATEFYSLLLFNAALGRNKLDDDQFKDMLYCFKSILETGFSHPFSLSHVPGTLKGVLSTLHYVFKNVVPNLSSTQSRLFKKDIKHIFKSLSVSIETFKDWQRSVKCIIQSTEINYLKATQIDKLQTVDGMKTLSAKDYLGVIKSLRKLVYNK